MVRDDRKRGSDSAVNGWYTKTGQSAGRAYHQRGEPMARTGEEKARYADGTRRLGKQTGGAVN